MGDDYAAVQRERDRLGTRIGKLESRIRDGEAHLRDLAPVLARLRRQQKDKQAAQIEAEHTRTENAISADTKTLSRLSRDRLLLTAKLRNLRRR